MGGLRTIYKISKQFLLFPKGEKASNRRQLIPKKNIRWWIPSLSHYFFVCVCESSWISYEINFLRCWFQYLGDLSGT